MMVGEIIISLRKELAHCERQRFALLVIVWLQLVALCVTGWLINQLQDCGIELVSPPITDGSV